MSNHSALAVLTGNSLDEILAVGGSASWVLNEKHAKRQRYLVCVRNAPSVDFADHEPHGAAFLVGIIKDLRHVGHDAKGLKRWTIEISEYATILKTDTWGEWRNPVKYTSLEELGINPKSLKFRPMPKPTKPVSALPSVRPLSIAEAKQGLSAQFGVPIEAIEIVIKG
jgi:hypothetical protein